MSEPWGAGKEGTEADRVAGRGPQVRGRVRGLEPVFSERPQRLTAVPALGVTKPFQFPETQCPHLWNGSQNIAHAECGKGQTR